MKRNRLFAGVLALAMAAVTICSPMCMSSVKAAEVTDKVNIDFEIRGNYTEKKISEADVTALAKVFDYDRAATGIYICSADATGFIDWDNSAIASWKVYQTEVFQPVLSRDVDENLVVATDKDGEVQKVWSTYAFYGTKTTDAVGHRMEDAKGIEDRYFPDNSGGGASNSKPFSSHTYYMTNEELNQNTFYEKDDDYTDWYVYGRLGSGIDYVLSENHFCLSAECDRNIQTINNHLGLTELTTWKTLSAEKQAETQKFYESEQTQITDAYVIRVYYTIDDIEMNWTRRSEYEFFEKLWGLDKVSDVYGNVYEGNFYDLPITTEDREAGYTDFWILPEGVDTVLNVEDMESDGSTNIPSDTSKDDNISNDNTTAPTESYVVDFSDTASQTVTKEDFAAILEANKASDVVIKSNHGVTFTFAKGTMTAVDGKESYDFSTSMNSTYSDSMPSYIQKNSFVSQINFNYSGKLPAAASIRFYVGTDYAGKTLYYSLMNKDNTFAFVNSYIVDAEGYITVQQDHCSSYVLTTERPKQEDNDEDEVSTDNGSSATDTTKPSDDNTASPKTGDTTNLSFMMIVMIFAAGGIVFFVKKQKTA